MADKPRVKVLLSLFVLFFATYGYFYQSGQHNENARFDQVRAIVEKHTLNIDAFSSNTADIVKYGEHYYPNKAPGLTFLSVPSWWIFSKIGAIFFPSTTQALHFVTYAVSWTTVGLLSAVLCLLLYLVLHRLTASGATAAAVTLAYGLGTIAFPFATVYFSHQAAACMIFAGFTLLFFEREREWEGGNARAGALMLSGILAGYSVTTEYSTALAVPLLAAYLFLSLRKKNLLLFFLAGVCLGVVPNFAYNYAVFGRLFYTPYSVYATAEAASFPEHKIGFLGVGAFSLQTLLQITFMPQRGLFYCNPWLVTLLVAPVVFFLRHEHKREYLVAILLVLAYAAFNASYGTSLIYWGGGASIGPRHMLPALPFMAVLAAGLVRRPFVLGFLAPLILFSLFFMLLAVAVEPRVPYEYANPLRHLYLENYLHGRFALHDGGVFSDTFTTRNSVAFNLGKLIGLRGVLELLPLLVFWLLMIPMLFKDGPVVGKKSASAARIVLSLFTLAFVAAPFAARYASAAGGHEGLRGTYMRGLVFDKPEPEYEALNTDAANVFEQRVDAVINFDWDPPPIPGPFSVEWTGFLIVDNDGDYTIGTEADDGAALYIDGRLVESDWADHAAARSVAFTHLTAGRHPLVLRYYNNLFGGKVKLFWAPPLQHFHVIPSDRLSAD